MLFTRFTALILLIPGILSAPSPLREVKKVSGRKKPNGYVVVMKAGASRDGLLTELGPAVSAVWDPSLVNGFSGTFNTTTLEIVRAHPDVAYITENGGATSAGFMERNASHPIDRRSPITENGSPWGLQRISQSAPLPSGSEPWPVSYTYRYESTAQGEGVDVYILDSGINTAHNEFEGRASWGATFGPGYADADGLGHGTHCAGTVAGRYVGVSKKAHVIAVKVLGDNDVAWWDDVVSGLNWIKEQVAITGRPSVVNISLQGGGTSFVDDAITELVNQGIHVVVCAGNFNVDVSGITPARAAGAVTVAAMDITDAKWSDSDFGSGVEIWAPGVIVFSTYIGGVSSYAFYSGTSMAAPHVAGLIANIISDQGNMSPAAMTTLLQQMALPGILSGVPAGTPNLLANNGFTV